MPSARNKTDYAVIKQAYITGTDSYRELGKKFGINYSSLAQKAKRDGWPAMRSDFRRNVSIKEYEHLAEETARRAVTIREKTITVAESALDVFAADLEAGKVHLSPRDAVEFMKYLQAATQDPAKEQPADGPSTVINIAQFEPGLIRELAEAARRQVGGPRLLEGSAGGEPSGADPD